MKYKDDPTRSGRVQVRIYNEQNDEQEIKEEDLPWAVLAMPSTNPSTFKLGTSPHGLKPGSRVLVTYMPWDLAEQYPIIIASLPRGDKPKKGGVGQNKEEAREHSGGKIDKPAIDNPAYSKKQADKKAFDQGKTVYHNTEVLDQKKPKIVEGEVKYADPPTYDENDDAKQIKDVREKLAKNADKPTTASADQGQTDMTQIVQQVDPQKQAQVLPQLYQQMQSMSSIMMMGMGGGAGGGSGSNNNQTPTAAIPSGVQNTIQDSFTGALAILVRSYGFERVIDVFTTLLTAENKKFIDPAYRNIVINALSNLIKLALYFGPLDIPVSQYSNGVFGKVAPPSDKIVLESKVPDLWRKVYYTQTADPYPGYQEWVSYEDVSNKLWVRKPEKYYHFSSASQEVFYTSETEIAADLEPYIKVQSPQPKLTIAKLNSILRKQNVNIENNTMNNAIGNNSGNNNQNNLQNMLGGQLKQLIQGMMSDQMSKTVLQGNVKQGIEEYTKHMGITNQLFELGSSALGGGQGGLGSLSNMGGIGNIMGGFSSGGGGIGGVLGNVTGGAGLLGSFGGFGGNSNGGGGGAGSGFPTAGFGQYNGGNVSDSGLKNINELLLLLGVQYE